jgi:N-[(2S)-2-amino-2-carboxyethyl]-L-glutamate dehydrogenase
LPTPTEPPPESLAPDARGVLVLGAGDLGRVGGRDPQQYLEPVRQAFASHARGETVLPLKPYLYAPGPDHHPADRIIAMPAHVGGVSGLKWIGSKHDNPTARGLPRASAVIVLNDPATNRPIAILEGALISSMRTAAASLVASQLLARSDSATVAIVGCGVIGQRHAEAFTQCWPALERLVLHDVETSRAVELSEFLSRRGAVDVDVAADAEAAARAADILVTCTVGASPYVERSWLSPGSFVANVSLVDVTEDVFTSVDKLVVDDWDQCNREGKTIHQLTTRGVLSREDLYAELGEVVVGTKPGRENEEEIILLNPMGIAITDVACAHLLYRAAVAAGVGTWFDLEGTE